MPVEYSRRELAQRLARSPTDVARASGRIQHWTEKGLFAVLGEKHVGRGRARRYPEGALWLAAFFDHCADRGASVQQMSYWAMPFGAIGVYETKLAGGLVDPIQVAEVDERIKRPFKAAITGSPKYMLIREPPPSSPSSKFIENPCWGESADYLVLPRDWLGASVFNLTAIFDRVRR